MPTGRAACFALASVGLASLVLAGVASAGTDGDPEVVDAIGDALDTSTALPIDAPALDLAAVWLEETSTGIAAHVRVADLAAAFRGQTTFRQWNATWDAHGVTWQVEVLDSRQGQRSASFSVVGTSASGLPQAGAPTFGLSSDTITVEVPKSFTARVGGETRAFSFAEGATLSGLRAAALDGTGLTTCSACAPVDAAGPG
ncbi:MAG TPA: hypothetical protein VI997_08800, partial [Candidatus Thermoplasmatota archaeon]|nr:hypothetical protein [Candidatus Thermoplasmatota archaeon]